MNKTAQVTVGRLISHQIVIPSTISGWTSARRVAGAGGRLRASMEMGQLSRASGCRETCRSRRSHGGDRLDGLVYHREFSNYRKADVTSKIKIPKGAQQ